ncbi:MAG: hypothetical protein MUC36_13010 [Planctomycetes bacterium]|jgi:hypothetical protein|nr:hypothetical protein [Planctomycetota bacterium]
MSKLFLFDNGPSAMRLFQRPALRELVRARRWQLAIACCADDAYLFEDLTGPNARLLVSDLPCAPSGAVVDLRAWQPPDHQAIDLSLETYEDTRSPQWKSVVTVLNRQLAARAIDFRLAHDEAEVPMLDFAGAPPTGPLPRPSIYLDTVRHRDVHCHFVVDHEHLLAALPEFDFRCTEPPPFPDPRLVDDSHLDLRQRSWLSERCAALIGMTRTPFNATLTTANRWKPKVVCGYDPVSYPSFWDYQGNPLEYVETMDQLVQFLLAALWRQTCSARA